MLQSMSPAKKQLTLAPIQHVEGEVQLPGSKSISNRALLLASLAEGKTHLTNLLKSDDTERMVEALRQLQVDIKLDKSWHQAEVKGQGGLLFKPSDPRFFLGNAGTAIRPLTALLSLVPGEHAYVIDGDEAMRQRPINHLVDALRSLGASIDYLVNDKTPPIKIAGGGIKGGDVQLDGSISSQYLTALLMSLPLAKDDSRIAVKGELVSKPYIDITLGIMRTFGVNVSHDDYQEFLVPGSQTYQSPGDFLIEGDASSASYFLAAAAIKGGRVRVTGLGENSVQGDIQFLDVLEKMGARVARAEQWVEVASGELHGLDADLNHIPDTAMTVAATALFAKGKTVIRNIYNWQVKETDRLHAMATELRKLGADVETGRDYISIDPPARIQPATIDTWNDHRMAMCFSLAALGDAEIIINDPDCTRKTFPDYFKRFEAICS